MNQRPDVSCCFAPFCEADTLVPSDSLGRVLVESHMCGVHHEPLHVRLVDTHFQQPFPNSRIAPTDEASVRIAPPAVFRRQVAPGRSSPRNPEDGVDEFPVVLGDSAPRAWSPRDAFLETTLSTLFRFNDELNSAGTRQNEGGCRQRALPRKTTCRPRRRREWTERQRWQA